MFYGLMMVWMTKTCNIHWYINKSFEVFNSMHSHILDASSTTPNKCILFIYYISIPCFSYMFQCISHHLQGEFTHCLFKNPFFLHSYYLWYRGCIIKYKRFTIIFFYKTGWVQWPPPTHAHTHTHAHARTHTWTHKRSVKYNTMLSIANVI